MDDQQIPVMVDLNGQPAEATVSPRLLLADLLRDDLGLTGTRLGCEQGVCGSCTVIMDGEEVRSCLVFAAQADGTAIRTVEGLAATEDRLSCLQQAFADNDALQCGFCTPGFLMASTALLERQPDPDEATVREALSGNLCRCTGYGGIVQAVLECAAAAGGGAPTPTMSSPATRPTPPEPPTDPRDGRAGWMKVAVVAAVLGVALAAVRASRRRRTARDLT